MRRVGRSETGGMRDGASGPHVTRHWRYPVFRPSGQAHSSNITSIESHMPSSCELLRTDSINLELRPDSFAMRKPQHTFPSGLTQRYRPRRAKAIKAKLKVDEAHVSAIAFPRHWGERIMRTVYLVAAALLIAMSAGVEAETQCSTSGPQNNCTPKIIKLADDVAARCVKICILNDCADLNDTTCKANCKKKCNVR